MSLELSKSGMGPDISVKFCECSPMENMTSSKESKQESKKARKQERKKERKKESRKEGIQ